MQRAAAVALWTQLLVAACFVLWVAALGPHGGLQVVGLYFYYAPFAGVLALFGVWIAVRRPALRRRGIAIALIPFAAILLPPGINALLGGPLLGRHLLAIGVALGAVALITSVFAPRRVVAFIPDGLFRSRFLNGLILFALVTGWVVFLLVLAFTVSESDYRRDTGMGLAYAIVLAGMYVVAMGLASVAVAGWAWLGLRGGVANACRKLNVAQLVVAVPGLVVGGIAFGWFVSQG